MNAKRFIYLFLFCFWRSFFMFFSSSKINSAAGVCVCCDIGKIKRISRTTWTYNVQRTQTNRRTNAYARRWRKETPRLVGDKHSKICVEAYYFVSETNLFFYFFFVSLLSFAWISWFNRLITRDFCCCNFTILSLFMDGSCRLGLSFLLFFSSFIEKHLLRVVVHENK